MTPDMRKALREKAGIGIAKWAEKEPDTRAMLELAQAIAMALESISPEEIVKPDLL